MRSATRALVPELVITPPAVHEDALLLIDAQGRSLSLVPREEAVGHDLVIDPLPRRALLPGFVNAHSHVFQRRLRGRTHHGTAGHDSFWTWREQMYVEAARLTPDSLYETARAGYAEMPRAGYTAVGEFHYAHHAPDGRPYDDPLVMAAALSTAASETGIRLVLLPVAYARDGFDRPSDPLQRRFCFPTVEQYRGFVNGVRTLLRDPRHTLDVVPHSVRVVPNAWLAPIVAYARSHELVVEECALMAGARVCVCPTTEGDLGDGIAPYAAFVAHGIPLASGSDGQTRIDPLEELRWAEFSARMRYQRRRVLTPDAASPGRLLLAMGTMNGAARLGIAAGLLEPGHWADAVAIDLDHPSMYGATPADLRGTLVFGAGVPRSLTHGSRAAIVW